MKNALQFIKVFPFIFLFFLDFKTINAQCVPNNRATYNINMSGSSSNGPNFNRTAKLVVDPRITAAGAFLKNNTPQYLCQ